MGSVPAAEFDKKRARRFARKSDASAQTRAPFLRGSFFARLRPVRSEAAVSPGHPAIELLGSQGRHERFAISR